MSKFSKVAAILIAASYFPNYPKATEFHVTEDEQVFEDLNNATNHARSLSTDEVVFTVTREEAATAIDLEKETAKTEAANKKAAEASARLANEETAKAEAAQLKDIESANKKTVDAAAAADAEKLKATEAANKKTADAADAKKTNAKAAK